jgi:hypothetical protein
MKPEIIPHIFWLVLVLLLLFANIVYAQRVYIPTTGAIGYANYDDQVVIIRMSKNLSLAEYIFIALHEYAHFDYYYKTPQEKREVKAWYNNLTTYASNYSQTCTKCTRHEEEYAERFAKQFYCVYNYSALPDYCINCKDEVNESAKRLQRAFYCVHSGATFG